MNAHERVMRKLLAGLPADATDDDRVEVLLTEFSLTEQGKHHGTYARWQIEYAEGKKPCRACVAARHEYAAAWRERRKEARDGQATTT